LLAIKKKFHALGSDLLHKGRRDRNAKQAAGQCPLSRCFGAVVTCFFIDTATNIYEYIELIEQLLKPGGVWVNVGPVQWLRNALLRPSVDELKDLISFHGFDIVHWKVDSTPVPYQQDDSSHGSTTNNDQPPFIRTTNFDAYRPLRFVAIRRNDNKE
jgi:hypothetical protein